jgi:hypothetical protein
MYIEYSSSPTSPSTPLRKYLSLNRSSLRSHYSISKTPYLHPQFLFEVENSNPFNSIKLKNEVNIEDEAKDLILSLKENLLVKDADTLRIIEIGLTNLFTNRYVASKFSFLNDEELLKILVDYIENTTYREHSFLLSVVALLSHLVY